MNVSAPDLADIAFPSGFLARLLPEKISRNDLVSAIGQPGDRGEQVRAREAAFAALLLPALRMFRDAGRLSPCPNLGDRKIHRVMAWNDFVRNGSGSRLGDLMDAPLPRIVGEETLIAISAILGEAEDGELALPAGLAAGAVEAAENAIRKAWYPAELAGRSRTVMTCDLTGKRLTWGGTAFAPILLDGETPAKTILLGRLAEYCGIPAPSGDLVLIPAPSMIPEIGEILDGMLPEDGLRAEIFREATGGVMMTLSAVSTVMFIEEGVIRFAGLKEGCTIGGRTGYAADLWEPVILDRGRLAALLSDSFPAPDEANAWIGNHPGLRVISAGDAEALHACWPVAGKEKAFAENFRLPGLSFGPRIRSHFFLLRNPPAADP